VTLCTGGIVGRHAIWNTRQLEGVFMAASCMTVVLAAMVLAGCRSGLRNLKPERADAVPTKVVSCPPADIK
jgi:hypothetical protein